MLTGHNSKRSQSFIWFKVNPMGPNHFATKTN